MWTIQEVKEWGRSSFKANYWYCVLAAFLLALFTGAGGAGGASSASGQQYSSEEMSSLVSTATPGEIAAVLAVAFGALSMALLVSLLFKVFLTNPIELGGRDFFRRNADAAPAPFSLRAGFQNYWHNFGTLLLRDLYLILWFLLLVVPGLIKAYSYSMVPYILAEHPELSAKEVITRSREMMDGNKWQAFLLDLSFIGWILLGALTLGLVFVFWTGPYMESTHAALYLKLKEQQGIE